MTIPTGRDLLALPKGHLHLHLEGGMRADTLAELAHGYGMEVPVVSGFGSFTAFADMYVATCAVLRTPEDLARLVDETVADAAASGAVWFEPSFYPPHHRATFGSDEASLEIVLDALAAAAKRHRVACGLMMGTDRTQDPAEAVALAKLAVSQRDAGVVSLGLANDEVVGAPEEYAEAFEIGRAGGLLSTPHAGELCGPESVRGAIDVLGANRLQHGVRAIEDPDLVKQLADDGICCDVCPTSNVLLSVVPDFASHPLPALLAAGVPCSINGDDPLLFGPGLLEEYELCRTDLGLSDEDFAAVARASLVHSGAPADVVSAGLVGVNDWIATPA